jgi:hypothetical protein
MLFEEKGARKTDSIIGVGVKTIKSPIIGVGVKTEIK